MNVLYVYADFPHELNCSKWNCFKNADAINKLEGHEAHLIHVAEWNKNTENSIKLSTEADIIVVERNYFQETLVAIQYWKMLGKTLVGVFDDAYHLLHPSNPAYRFWNYGDVVGVTKEGERKQIKIDPTPIKQFKWGVKLLKGIQIPSKILAEDWSLYTDTYYVPNYIDIDNYLNVEPMFPHPEDEIWIGWHGSLTHSHSFIESGAMDALRKIGKKYPNVKFYLGGDKKNFENLEAKNKIYQGYVDEDKFPSMLKSFDIGLAPLSGEYDKRRSRIKVLEYMALRIPWVATDYPTYAEFKGYGVMIENGYRNWVSALTDMIENISEYKEKAKGKAYEYALTQSYDINVPRVTLPLYQKLIDGEYPNILRGEG